MKVKCSILPLLFAITSVIAFTFIWYATQTKVSPNNEGEIIDGGDGYEEIEDEQYRGTELISFENTSEDKSLYEVRHGFTNGGMFRSYWDRDNVVLDDGIANISLYDKDDKNYGAEIKTYQGYLYGYFGGRAKTFKKSGTVQYIFTYTGGWKYDHDEIDIEFLGKDTTKVQFNYYDNGVGGHEYVYDLGFDSSEDFHDYGFKWEADRIIWFVDFRPVYSVKATLDQWGFLFVNVWAGQGVDNWLGEYTPQAEKLTAEYAYLSYAPLGE